jgi:transposase InsO family protein
MGRKAQQDHGNEEAAQPRSRDECLNTNSFWSLGQARVVITDWKHNYNHHRRHSALGHLTPADYAASCTDQMNDSRSPWSSSRGAVKGASP